ncbi:MAG TPA: DUF1549 and DUF1553 domain-containing protein [Gemmataceae bacterium]|nr:DUF1549 and DUF1553 domain-containing protein [Gemmataceae bacterium]
MRFWVCLAILGAGFTGSGLRALAADAGAPGRPSPRGEAAPWAFTPPRKVPLPEVKNKDWVANPIDAFILARLEADGLTPSARADKLTLLRRVTFDLTGLPPTPEEQAAFLADNAPDAYLRVVDRLLASPRYGERWAQHWLDLVRYAETDGFKADDLRPNAYRYRDYVIRALNQDLPYDRFVRQQLAGDELEPDNPEALTAAGLNRLWPDEYNAANLEQRRQEILDDVTETTALVFLGLTFGCARCHDHKFDPILQTDYYRLQAFFAPLLPSDDRPALDPAQEQEYRRRLAAWEEATRPIRQEMEALLAGKREEMGKYALTKFRPEIQQAYLTPEEQRTPYQKQIAYMAGLQVRRAEQEAPTKMTGEKKQRYQELEKKLAAMTPGRPEPLPTLMTVTDVGREAPPTHVLDGGDWRKPRQEVQPGFPDFLGGGTPDTRLDGDRPSTGRRAALARWLTRPDHPLTARVIVNRLWQHHFGRGIVATPNDFGSQGEPPTHPELLDWLAVELVENGWSLKHLHRLMVTSSAYCQTSLLDPNNPAQARAQEIDPGNALLWRARRWRLEGEAIRDAMLSVAGDLNLRMHGPSARPPLPEGISKYAWKPDPRPEDYNRRSVYVLVKRNLRYPLFDTFDQPDLHNSCACRPTTTSAPQALLLLNGEFTLERARQWAARLLARFPRDERSLVAYAYQAAWGRVPSDDEIRLGLRFIEEQAGRAADDMVPSAGLPEGVDRRRAAAVADFCHAVLNANEFLYVD